MHKILVGYDGSEAARRGLERSTEMFGDAEIAVISIAPYLHDGPHGNDPTYTPQQPEEEAEEARDLLASLGTEARVIVARGDPATLICDVADRDGFDTIVVGSRALHGIKKALLGSVSTHVVTQASCDVLIVK